MVSGTASKILKIEGAKEKVCRLKSKFKAPTFPVSARLMAISSRCRFRNIAYSCEENLHFNMIPLFSNQKT